MNISYHVYDLNVSHVADVILVSEKNYVHYTLLE